MMDVIQLALLHSVLHNVTLAQDCLQRLKDFASEETWLRGDFSYMHKQLLVANKKIIQSVEAINTEICERRKDVEAIAKGKVESGE